MAEEQPGRLGQAPPAGADAEHSPEPEPEPEPEFEAEPELKADVEVGQIWLVRPDDDPSVTVLIIEVHDGYVQGLLCGEECDLATETDAVLEARQSGCLGRLLVHGDLSAPILKTRLGEPIGATAAELAERIATRGRGRDFGSRDLGRGSPIVSDDDARWEWKQRELGRLRGVRARASELGWTLHKLGEGNRSGAGPPPRGAA
jgi:hypothetical protein